MIQYYPYDILTLLQEEGKKEILRKYSLKLRIITQYSCKPNRRYTPKKNGYATG